MALQRIVKGGLTSFTLMGISDIICQVVVEKRKFNMVNIRDQCHQFMNCTQLTHIQKGWKVFNTTKHPHAVPLNDEYDVFRTMRMAVVGLTWHGPFFSTALFRINKFYGTSKHFLVVVKKSLTTTSLALPIFLPG